MKNAAAHGGTIYDQISATSTSLNNSNSCLLVNNESVYSK